MRTYSAAVNEGDRREPEFRKAEFPGHLTIGEPKAKTELTIYGGKKMDYKNAGVDIEAGYESVELMKEHR